MALRLLVLGGTGHIGTHVVDLALARGHDVTAFVRAPQKVKRETRNAARLNIIQGSLLATGDLARALPGHDAVVSSVGPPPREAFRRSTLMAESAASLVAAMTRSHVNRLAMVSAAVLFPDPRLRFRFFRWLLREHARDLAAMEAVVRATELDWTIARPPRLVNGTNESYRWRDEALPEGAWSMPFRAVAACLVDCAESGAHTRALIGLGAGAGARDGARTEREASA